MADTLAKSGFSTDSRTVASVAPAKRRRTHSRYLSPVLQVSSVLIALLVWQAATEIHSVVKIPSPFAAVQAALLLDQTAFVADLALSFYRVSLGFTIAAILGIPLGIAIGYSRFIRALVFPTVEVLRPIPPIAWIPLAILFFPQTEWMIIFLTFYGAFFPIVYNTIGGVVAIPLDYIRAGKSLGANEWTLFWHVTLPAMLPSVFTGLNVAMGVAWLMVVAGEMIASKGGIGAMTWESYQTGRYPLIFVGMAAIGVLGYVSSVAIRLIAKSIIRWEERK